MATWVANGTPGTTSATLPAGTASGDYVMVAAYGTTATLATLPAGWTTCVSRNVSPSIMVSYREYDGVWTMPTFTGAARCVSTTIRPAAGKECLPGISANQGATSTSITWAAMTLQVADGTSQVLRFANGVRPDVVIPTPTGHTLIDANGTRPAYGTYRLNTTTSAATVSVTVSRSDVWSTAQVEVKDITPVAVTQAAYGFYNDGTETGSTALAGVNTAPTIDVTQGDVNTQLRMRLQSTTTTLVPATDDWCLQWEKNANGTWTDVDAVTTTARAYDSAYLTNAAATTNRLGAGTGTFVAGKVAEDGFTDDVGWSANNYTELLYTVKLIQADLTNGDVLRFRILRNDAISDTMTYSSTPTINVTRTLPAVTQAGYRFFDQGAENTSVALAAQNTAHTGDITLGDGLGQLRVLLQSTNIAPLPATDDWQLQFEKNSTGIWLDLGVLDSYLTPQSPQVIILGDPVAGYIREGQSFLGAGAKLTRADFWLARQGTVSGNVTATLYATTTGGIDGMATGTALATSTAKLASSISLTASWVRFDFDGSLTLTKGVGYVIAVEASGMTSPNSLLVTADTISSHLGRRSQFDTSWTQINEDLLFRVYDGPTIPYNDPSLTDGQATTNRLTGGTGTFSAGKVSEDGLVDDVGFAANGFTELLYPVQMNAAAFVSGDSVRFRVLRNGATTGMTYSQTPTVNLVAATVGVNQAAYRFYDQGTESGSVALGAQNTSILGNLNTGDGIGQLRVRLQSTTAAPLPATDDWQLQWEKNGVGTWADVGYTFADVDVYGEANLSVTSSISAVNQVSIGQSFTGNGQPLWRAGFWACRLGAPTSTIKAELFSHSGTYGTSSVGATLLATSTVRTAGTFTTTRQWEYFDFDGTFTLVNGTRYVIVLTASAAFDGTNAWGYGSDLSPAHGGNQMTRVAAGTWTANSANDLIFRVQTRVASASVAPYNDPSLTDGQATTNRLTGGTGTFSSGRVSEDGLVDDFGFPGNNFTELVYPVQISKPAFIGGDTIRFRVLRNGATTGLTYGVTPTIDVVRDQQGTASFNHNWTMTATGVAPVAGVKQGTASFSHNWNLTATGENGSEGTAAFNWSSGLTAVGKRNPVGQAFLNHQWAISATGSTGEAEMSEGTAAFNHSWSFTAEATPIVAQFWFADTGPHPGINRGDRAFILRGTLLPHLTWLWGDAPLGVVSSPNVATVPGPIPGIEVDFATQQIHHWITLPIDRNVTISGNVDLQLWQMGTAGAANSAVNCVVDRMDSQGNIVSEIFRSTNVVPSTGTSTKMNFTATATSTNLLKGDRLRARIFFDDAPAGQNMASGTATTAIGGAAGAASEAYVKFAQPFAVQKTEPNGSKLYLKDTASIDTGTPAAPANLAFYESATWFTGYPTGTQRTITGVSWNAGDRIYVAGGTESSINSQGFSVPTNANLLFQQVNAAASTGGTTECSAWIWVAVAASSQTNQTISANFTILSGNSASGLCAWVVPGAIGEANGGNSRTEASQTAILQRNSTLLYFCADFNSLNPNGKTPLAASGTVTARRAAGDGTAFGQNIIDWQGVAGGSTTFGLNNYTSLTVAQVWVEVLRDGPMNEKEMWTDRGPISATAQVNTVLGWTPAIQWTSTPGANPLEWYSKTLNAFTLDGLVGLNLRIFQSTSGTASCRAELAICNADGSGAVIWGAGSIVNTPAPGGNWVNQQNGRLPTAETAIKGWLAGATTAVATGKRLRLRVFIDDEDISPLSSGRTASLVYNGPVANTTGDTWIQLPQVVTEYVPAVTVSKYRFYFDGTETSSAAAAAENSAAAISDVVQNLQLRVQLQSTNDLPIPSTTDWQLEYDSFPPVLYAPVPNAGIIAYTDSVNLTDQNATTARLSAGTGTFVAGRVTEDGRADDVGWSGNNYTELVFSIQTNFLGLEDSDSFAFRVVPVAEAGAPTVTQGVIPQLIVSLGAAGSSSGSMAPTDGRDTLASRVDVYRGIIATTDGRDTLAPTVDTQVPVFTGTLALTDGADTLTSGVTFTAVRTATLDVSDRLDVIGASVSAEEPGTYETDLILVDGRDTLAASVNAQQLFQSTLSATDDPDELAATGSTTVPTFDSTVARTDGVDTLEASVEALGITTGALVATDGLDTMVAAASRTVPVFTSENVVVTDGQDTLVATATAGTFGAAIITVTDGVDTMVATATAGTVQTATLDLTDGADALVATPSTTAPTYTGTLALTDGADTLVASGDRTVPIFIGLASATDNPDTLVASGSSTVPIHTGTLVLTDNIDTITAAGTTTAPIFTGTLALTDQPDTLVAAATAGEFQTSSLARTDGLDAIVTTVDATVPTFTSTLSISDRVDTLVAPAETVVPTHLSTFAQTDNRDTLVAASESLPPPNVTSLLYTEAADTIASTGVSTPPGLNAFLSLFDGLDTLALTVSTTAPTYTSTLALTDNADTLTSVPTAAPPEQASTLSVSDNPDTLAVVVTTTPPTLTGTLVVVDRIDTLATSVDTEPPTLLGTAAATDSRDTLVASASAFIPTFDSTLVLTDGVDDMVATANHAPPGDSAGAITVTDGEDTLVATATAAIPTFSGALVVTDGRDTLVAVLQVIPINDASIVLTDRTDTMVAQATADVPTLVSALVITEAPDTMVATASTVVPTFTSSLVITEAPDQIGAVGTSAAPGNSAAAFTVSDGLDTMVAAATRTIPTISAALVVSDGVDTLEATPDFLAVNVLIFVLPDGQDTMRAFADTVVPMLLSTMSGGDNRDTMVGSAQSEIPIFTSTLGFIDGADNLDATATAAVPLATSTVVFTDGRDTLSASVSAVVPLHTASVDLSDGLDTLVANVVAGAVGAGVLGITDGLDTMVATASTTPPTLTGTLAVPDGRDDLVAEAVTVPPVHSSTLVLADKPDTLVAVGVGTPPLHESTLELTDGSDTMAAAVVHVVPTFSSTVLVGEGRDTFAAVGLHSPPGNSAGGFGAVDGRDTMAAAALCLFGHTILSGYKLEMRRLDALRACIRIDEEREMERKDKRTVIRPATSEKGILVP